MIGAPPAEMAYDRLAARGREVLLSKDVPLRFLDSDKRMLNGTKFNLEFGYMDLRLK